MTNLVEFLYRALDAELGIELETSNPELLRQKLYAARRQAKNPEFQDLSILLSRSRPATHVWIVRKSPSPTESENATEV